MVTLKIYLCWHLKLRGIIPLKHVWEAPNSIQFFVKEISTLLVCEYRKYNKTLMEFYIADNIKYVLQTKRRLIPFSPALILSNHTDNTFCCDFDIDLTLIFVYHSTL